MKPLSLNSTTDKRLFKKEQPLEAALFYLEIKNRKFSSHFFKKNLRETLKYVRLTFATKIEGGIYLPTNKKEGIIFTTMMCFLMVLGMSIYNLWLHDSLTLTELLIGLIPGFIVAFILDVFVVGGLAKKIAFSLPINPEKKLILILTISTLMILGMVTCMSLFGILMENGLNEQLFSQYLTAWKMNVIVALPLQLLIVGPISRKVLQQIQTA